MTLLRDIAADQDKPRCRVCAMELNSYRAEMGVCVDCVSRETYAGLGLKGPRYGFTKPEE